MENDRNFFEVLKNRHSCRSYSDKPVDPACFDKLYEAVKYSPSACNRQPWRFMVVTDAVLRSKICSLYSRPFLAEAPAIIVALGNDEECWKRLDGSSILPMDIGIAMQNLVLAATACGLGTCWICAYDVPKMGAALGIKPPWSVQAISPLGYPAAELAEAPHKDKSAVFEVI